LESGSPTEALEVIDWIDAIVPCHHVSEITGGKIERTNADGSVEWKRSTFRSLPGSFETAIQFKTAWRSDTGDCTHLHVSGNLAKFFQGHNLWGSDDPTALVVEFMEWLTGYDVQTGHLGLTPYAEDVAAWMASDYQFTRIDYTETFHLDSEAEVLSYIRAAEHTAHLAHRGRGQLCEGSTLYFGKHSRRWALKLYAKGPEVRKNAGCQPAILRLPSAQEWAAKSLRCELVLRSMELKRKGLDRASAWVVLQENGVQFDPSYLIREVLGDMTMTTTLELSSDVLATLKPSLRLIYQAWHAGAEIRTTQSKTAFYRYRAQLLPYGIDIATVQPRELSHRSIASVLVARPADVPEWAQGTPLFFEPRLPSVRPALVRNCQALWERRAA
jgi:II/X family phage/plasmid replication protein